MGVVVAAVAYQPDWPEVVTSEFMRAAFAGGLLVALAAGMLGYFVVVRQHAFAAHALAHIGFPGATGALLIGLPVTLGLAVFCVGGALAIGLFGRRLPEREVVTGTILAFATGLGVLFSWMSSGYANTVTRVLFGNLLAITTDQLVVFAGFTLALAAVLALIARPLAFASVNPEVAEARGVPVRGLGVAFLVLLALVITMAVEVVGTLLLFGLVVTPAAAALAVTARPAVVAALATVIAVVSVVVGLVLSAMFTLPPSFLIVSISFVVWLGARVVGRERRPPRGAESAPRP